jgi:hypothetical protein
VDGPAAGLGLEPPGHPARERHPREGCRGRPSDVQDHVNPSAIFSLQRLNTPRSGALFFFLTKEDDLLTDKSTRVFRSILYKKGQAMDQSTENKI